MIIISFIGVKPKQSKAKKKPNTRTVLTPSLIDGSSPMLSSTNVRKASENGSSSSSSWIHKRASCFISQAKNQIN